MPGNASEDESARRPGKIFATAAAVGSSGGGRVAVVGSVV